MIAGEPTTLSVRRDGGTLHVTLDRPKAKNAMSSEMVAELTAVFESIAGEDDLRCVVLRGAGGTFCAGGDVRDMSALRRQPPEDGEDPAVTMNRAFGDEAREGIAAFLEKRTPDWP